MLSRRWHHAAVISRRYIRYSSTAKHEPLHILFCGADSFSITSLNALRDLQTAHRDLICSIDVVCRPDKRVGRGLKKVQEVPIKSIAVAANLPVHQVDTFTGWTPPASINLVVAVSFGLLVPSRILAGAKYGGLNVHPSLLPDLRGAAPIQHTLLQRRSHTGVTIQTMHPKRFDHGVIVAQSPRPGLDVASDATPQSLSATLAEVGAHMLVRTIQTGSFLESDTVFPTTEKGSLAPKITPSDRQIDWAKWTSEEVLLRDRVLGRLWDTVTFHKCMGPMSIKKRITFHGPWRRTPHPPSTAEVGELVVLMTEHPAARQLGIVAADGIVVSPSQGMTIEGEAKGSAGDKLINGLLRNRDEVRSIETPDDSGQIARSCM